MKKIYMIIVVLILSGCASMFSGTKETIIVQSEDRDARIYIGEEYE